jgi:hypothetical protein
MTAQHTPGPWTVVERAIEADSLDHDIFGVVVAWTSNDVAEPNAEGQPRLIAAAPDPLDFAKRLRAGSLYSTDELDTLIAKAEGRDS